LAKTLESGWDARDLGFLISSGIPLEAVESWLASGIPVREAPRWHEAGFRPKQASDWIGVEVMSPSAAQILRRSLQPERYLELITTSFDPEEVLMWVRHGWDGKNAEGIRAAFGRRLDRWRGTTIPPDSWLLWVSLGVSPEEAQAWKEAGIGPSRVERAVRQHNLQLSKVAEWVAAGLSRQLILQRHERRGTIEVAPRTPATRQAPPKESMAAIAAARRRIWDADAEPWVTSACVESSVRRTFLDELFDRSLVWANPTDHWFDEADDDWLDEVAGWAFEARSQVRKVPVWPVTFESSDLRIVLTEIDAGDLTACVEYRNRGVLVSFNMDSLDVWFRVGSPCATFAIGSALMWYVDCATTLPSAGQRLFERADRNGSGHGPTHAQHSIRYVPTAHFEAQKERVRSGGTTAMRMHDVAGHRRALPRGWRPSDEARRQAPVHLRRHMAPNETYVRGHARGAGERGPAAELRLGANSLLADALGLL
jgi:hypothetical protein